MMLNTRKIFAAALVLFGCVWSASAGWFDGPKGDIKEACENYWKSPDKSIAKINKSLDDLEKKGNAADALNQTDTHGCPPLFYAIYHEDLNLVDRMLRLGADCNWVINNQNLKNATALYFAAKSGDILIIKSILKHTTKYDERCSYTDEDGNSFSFTPVEWLIRHYDRNNYDIIEDLVLNKKANISSFFKDGSETSTPIIWANKIDDKRIKKLILDNINVERLQDTKVSFLEDDGKPCSGYVFSYLCFSYNPETFDCMQTINMMLEKSKNIDVNDKFRDGDYEYSPLYSFAKDALREKNPLRYEDIFKTLLSKGANPNESCNGQAPIHLIAQTGSEGLLELFIKDEYRGNLNFKDADGKTAMEYWNEYWEDRGRNKTDALADTYRWNKGKIDSLNLDSLDPAAKTSSDGRTVLQLAIKNKDENNALRMMEKWPDLWRDEDSQGHNALDYAFSQEHYCRDVVDYFVDKKIPIGKSIFSVIDNALETGDVTLLEKFLMNNDDDFKKDVRRQVEAGNRKINVDPAVYAAVFDFQNSEPEKKANSNSNKAKVLRVLVENKSRFTGEGLNEKFAGNTPIIICDDDETVKRFLIDYGADISIPGAEGFNAIDYAFRRGQTSIIDYLLEKKTLLGNVVFSAIDSELERNSRLEDFLKLDVEHKFLSQRKTENIDGQEEKCGPFVYAVLSTGVNKNVAQGKRSAVLKMLIENGADINETVRGGKRDGSPALSIAAGKGEAEVVDFLLSNNADLNKSDALRKTPLFYALESGNGKIVDRLLKASDQKVRDMQCATGETLLMYFARYGTFEQMLALLPDMVSENELVLSRKDDNGMTPFLYAAAYNRDFNVMKVLRMYGANVYARDNEGWNALKLAKENKNDENIILRLNSYGVY